MAKGSSPRVAAALALALVAATGGCGISGGPVEVAAQQGYDFVDFATATEPGVRITGTLVLPEEGAPRAAAILSHGAAGPGSRQERAAQLLAERGIAALVLDHFSARGVSSVARDQLRISEQQMVADISAARDALSQRLGLSSAEIGAVGWSKGATAVTLASVDRLWGFVAADAPPLAFTAAFYPFCGFRLDEDALASPLLLLLAGQDDWTPAGPCVRQAEAWAGAGQPVAWQLYENASHGFDSRAGRFRSDRAITVRDTSSRCTLQVDPAGRTVTLDGSGAINTPQTRRDYLAACGERGVTFAGDEEAGADATARLLAFIDAALP